MRRQNEAEEGYIGRHGKAKRRQKMAFRGLEMIKESEEAFYALECLCISYQALLSPAKPYKVLSCP
jgi:hypothetical protein